MLRILFFLVAISPAFSHAHTDWFKGGSNNKDWGEPAVPPSLHRPAIPARVLDPGQGRSGVQVSLLETRNSGRTNIYPYDENNRVTAGSFMTRWGLAPGGAELGGGIDYPFFVPSAFIRYQPFGRDWPYGTWITFEAGANLMPDYHAGGAVGVGLGLLEIWTAYRGGLVLERGYSELSAGATLRAAHTVDLGGGISWRRYDTVPEEQTARISFRADFGNSADPLAADQATGGAKAEELMELKRYKAAAQAYEDELEAYPNDIARWKGYATALEELGLVQKARRARQEALKLEAVQKGEDAKPEPEAEKDGQLKL